ncbi:alanine racemase C-terminal domain-containing protein [Microbacterium invictum]|uniref:Alanine racemase C-terminal domain-containing protein n=1 Tax=Microbacterium invictum TaxID=515415 RepID=A0ABZ0V737_9MICO|nr:alanine racemase C-terminal domain-containing protein [Microbacterium invictum]WQB69054.1 alanine racemase C-terminal domain-containing protein [Microbacterium invictum]
MSVDPLRPTAHDVSEYSGAHDHRPVALIRRSALAANLETAHDAGLVTVDPEVLEADGWGHGEAEVRRAVSEAGLGWATSDVDAVDGAHLFGLPGSRGVPAMAFRGRVVSTKRVLAGEGVSYGYTFRAAADTTVALVSGGYAQGVVRALGNRVAVRIAGRNAPVIGRVAMDVCVVDLGSTGRAEPGDRAHFFGDPESDEPSLDTWTAATGLTAGEIVAIVGARARRVASG